MGIQTHFSKEFLGLVGKVKALWQSLKKFIKSHRLAPVKGPADSLCSPVSDGSVRRLAARTPIHVPWDCLWIHRLALELPEGQSLPCISIPEVHVSPRDKTHVRVTVPSSLANFHGPKWPALPPFLSDRILDPPETFLQEFSLAGALQPPQNSFLPEPSKRLISPGLTWTLNSPCSVSWVIFLYLVFWIALKGSKCLSEASTSQGSGPPSVLCVYYHRLLVLFSLCLLLRCY